MPHLTEGSKTLREHALSWPITLWWITTGALIVGLASYISWFSAGRIVPSGSSPLIVGTIVTFALAVYVTKQMGRHDLEQSVYISAFFVTASLFLLLAATLLFLRVYYSRSFLMVAFVTAEIFILLELAWRARSNRWVYGFVQGDKYADAISGRAFTSVVIRKPDQSLEDVDGLVVDFDKIDEPWSRFVEKATISGISVYHVANFVESVTGRVSLAHLSPSQARDFHLHPFYGSIKRVIDFTAALLVLPILLVVTVFVAIAIKLDSPGPVFFRQERVGQQGTRFVILKFRSMWVGADARGHSFAKNEDPRVTRIGRFLRRTRLDELPQLFNVICGEMSLIGPRPEQVGFVREFENSIPFYNYRHLVRPGITGWAQVSHGYAASEASTREKLEYDLYYAKYCSIWLDLLIVFRTIRTVLTGFGVR